MDTAGYLTSQGWRGEGHALHHSGRGITKPIRVSQKSNVYGIGKKKHDAHADQWWARAFDDTLKGLNTTKNDDTGKMECISLGAGAQSLRTVGNSARWVGQGGLYTNFVKGEGLNGTLESEEQGSSKADSREGEESKEEDEKSLTWEKRDKSKEFKRRAQAQDLENTRQAASDIATPNPEYWDAKSKHGSKYGRPRDESEATETKEERRQRRKERRAKKAPQGTRTDLKPCLDNAVDVEVASSKFYADLKTRKEEKLHTKTLLTLEEEDRGLGERAKNSKRKKHRATRREEG